MKKHLSIFTIAICILLFSSCSKDKNNETAASKTFVLVHGAWQAPYAWQYVKAQLEQKGQKVVIVELPAHGSDTTAAQNVSMNVYRDKVIAAINQAGGKVILVGHSMGGVVVTAVAEQIPTQIEKLVYIGAFVPANGQSIQDLAATDSQSLLGPNLILSADQLTLDVKTENRLNVFCQDGSATAQALVTSNFRIEPSIPFSNPVAITASNYGQVSKYYIHTLQDHAIGMNLQNRMVAAANITNTYSVNTGHCPFLSMHDSVTNLLMTISK